jgi:hypothetical protein
MVWTPPPLTDCDPWEGVALMKGASQSTASSAKVEVSM